MPSIKSRVVKSTAEPITNPVPPLTTSGNSPGFSLQQYISTIAINRGIPPEQFMYDNNIYKVFPDRPTFRRGFSIISTINQNLALLAGS